MTYFPAVPSATPIDVRTLPNATLSSLLLMTLYDPTTGTPYKVDMRTLVPFVLNPAALLHAYGHAPNPMPTAKMDVLEVGELKQFGEIADAVTWANNGAVINVDDGVYYKPFHSDVQNLTIQSVSGNPYRCYVDGEGGMGGGKRLAYGKAMMHISGPTTIKGMGFRNCGSLKSPSDYSNEAGLYAEEFPTLGILSLYHCSFDNNGNAVFIPQVSATIIYKELECVFGYLAPNSQSNPANSGPSHDHYITPHSAEIDGSYMYGCSNGHSIKCEAQTLVVKNCPWICSWGGRAVEAAYGGAATITNCTIVARGDPLPDGHSAVGNFIGYADQQNDNIAITGNTMLFDNCRFLVGRGGDTGAVIFIGFGGVVTATNSTLKWFQYGNDSYGQGFLSYASAAAPGGTINGLQLGRPNAGDPNILSTPPIPPPIPSWLFV